MSRLLNRPEQQPHGRKNVRCAIYTRKSTEEGLDQAFNSLDAQREACAAYITSQRHEGWIPVDELYDDGGFSGGNMDRPGLKQLLAEVQAGRVDVIVVYKVDRLTRALSDFAKIVDVLDAAGASFVSITQSFNTTTSMGRLTLNVLLSFAQFEREVISERVRDKVAASKRKGMWMGGSVPLGYTVVDRKLVVLDAEAVTVRHIMARYLVLGSVHSLMIELAHDGITSKLHRYDDGRTRGGGPLGRGSLYTLLSNHTYVGDVFHNGAVFPGEQAAIVERETWDRVQVLLASNRVERHHQTNAVDPSLLAGMIKAGDGRRMSPSHAARHGLRYRYYGSVDDPLQPPLQATRIAAGPIEASVVAGLVTLVEDRATLFAKLIEPVTSGASTNAVFIAASELAHALPTMSVSQVRAVMLEVDLQVAIHADHIDATIDLAKLGGRLGYDQKDSQSLAREPLHIPSVVVRRGKMVQLTILPRSSSSPGRRDPKLIELIARAHAARRQLGLEGKPATIDACCSGTDRAELLRLARLSFLAPDITAAIVDGRQGPEVAVRRLTRMAGLPASWVEQRTMLGFAPR